MTFIDYGFQTNAVNKLYDTYIAREYGGTKKNNTILQAPTGSGKTAILVRLMDRILKNDDTKNIAFVWLTPGAGDLEEQSWRKTSENAIFVKSVFLEDSLRDGFQPGTATFLNWEMVSNKRHNIALKDGERANLYQAVDDAKERNVKFILIIDEEHRNQTTKAQHIIDTFNAEMIFRASATPLEDKSAEKVLIPEEDVIAEGLITRNVIINEQFNGGGSKQELRLSDEDFLDAADSKRKKLKVLYRDRKSTINPLVLIQFPDEKKSSEEVEDKVKQVRKYLTKELGQKEENIATWLSGEHINVTEIQKNDSNINYLLMKQAVSTGWDVPRAKILVKLRLNTSYNFTIQTIGRIRRMPERHYYPEEELNNSYVYSNDSNYVYEIIKQGIGSGITQMSLQKNINPDTFHIKSKKKKNYVYKDLETVTKALHKEFTKEFHLNNDVDHNKKQLEMYGWRFGREIFSTVKSGSVSRLEDIATQTKDIQTSIPIINTSDFGYRYDSVMALIKPYLHIGEDLTNIRAIVNDLFGVGEPGSDIKPLLQLHPKDRYAFIINNAMKIKNVVMNMDASYSYTFHEEVSLTDSNVTYEKFLLPVRDGYNDNGEKGKLLNKNVYAGYTTSNWVKQSGPEKMIEERLNSIKEIKWFYRSKDHGEKYFSITYDSDTREFFPDYLVKTMDGDTYILETKGAEKQNIDKYAHMKFDALKNYVQNECEAPTHFAFVRPSLEHKGILLYNNSKWEEVVDGSKYWKPLEELFK